MFLSHTFILCHRLFWIFVMYSFSQNYLLFLGQILYNSLACIIGGLIDLGLLRPVTSLELLSLIIFLLSLLEWPMNHFTYLFNLNFILKLSFLYQPISYIYIHLSRRACLHSPCYISLVLSLNFLCWSGFQPSTLLPSIGQNGKPNYSLTFQPCDLH